LRIPNVQEQSLRLHDLKFATDPANLSADGAVHFGDLLFIRTNGSRNLIGRGAVVLDELPKPYHFASYLIRLRILHEGRLPKWLGFVWHTPVVRGQILQDAASSAGQYNVSMKAATRFVVPMAPVAEQQRILAEVERIDSLADVTLSFATIGVHRAARLRQSILKWAFEGKLADQDPSDEPASVLLERIKAERAAPTAAKRTVTKKKARA
jgi:type I restriction enzyme S subunit